MSLSAKILAPMILLICLFAISTLYSARQLNTTLSQLSAVRSSLSSLPDSFREVIREGELIYHQLQRWDRGDHDPLVRNIRLRFAALNARLSESLIRLDSLQVPQRLNHIKRQGTSLHAIYVTLESKIIQRTTHNTDSSGELVDNWSSWLKDLDHLRNSLIRLSKAEEKQQRQIEAKSLYSALIFTSLSLALGLVFVIYISRLIRPLRALTQGVHSFGEGDYSHRIKVSGAHEFARLAEALNRMGAAIEQRDAQLFSEQQLRLQEASLTAAGRLSAQITHELRNPLSSIGLNSELLAEELSELGIEIEREVELKSLLGDISREVERLRSITEEYLRYARIPPPIREEINLNTLCMELIEFYRAEAERSAVQLILNPDPLPRPALADPNQVRSALLNLIRNACEALEGLEGIVVISIRTGSGEARVTVQDSGPGISTVDQKRIFEPFFSTKPQGTGLGLSMVSQLIRAQGGRVILERTTQHLESSLRPQRSNRPYELTGAHFSLYFPLAPLRPR